MAVASPRVELWRALQANTEKKNGWGEDRQKVVQMMLGHFDHRHQKNSATLDLLGLPGPAARGSELLELDQEQCIPSGWEKVLDLKTGAVYYVNSATGSRAPAEGSSERRVPACSSGERGGGGGEGTGALDLRLNLWAAAEGDSNPRPEAGIGSGRGSLSGSELLESSNASSASSSPSSCVSSERTSPGDRAEIAARANAGLLNNHLGTMVLVGCPRCLMYVMLSREDPRCPKCKSSVLLDFPHAQSSKRPRTSP